jgi:hypothetical protein
VNATRASGGRGGGNGGTCRIAAVVEPVPTSRRRGHYDQDETT